MGADLIWTGVWLNGNKKPEARKKAVLKHLSKMPIREEDWECFYDQTSGEVPLDDEDNIDKDQILEDAKKVIEEFFDSWNYRDVGSMGYYSAEFLFTAGMSWGDGPTESYDVFRRFEELPQELLEAGDCIPSEPYDVFLKAYKLPDKLKTDLDKWWTARQV
jgi:hypothetical protein